IVDSQIGRNECATRPSLRLSIEAVFASHPHQCVHEADVVPCDSIDSIGAVLPECVCDTIELPSLDGPAVEPQQSSDSTHQYAPPNSARRVNRACSVSDRISC